MPKTITEQESKRERKELKGRDKTNMKRQG